MKCTLPYIGILCTMPLLAHQPHLVESDTTIVHNPEVSQAFYATHPGTYIIEESQPFILYVQLLRPKIGELDKNIKATITQDSKIIALLDGNNGAWTFFHEPFANDDYYQGPEFSADAQGKYIVTVEGDGKYVLVVGTKEEWPPSVIIRTLYTLPRLKIYFEKSPLLAYWNISGAFAFGSIALTAAALLLIRFFLKKYYIKK